VERYFRDLDQQEEKGIYFDREAAQYRLDFYRFCRHSEGKWAGQVFEPAPWQQFLDWNIYGWKWRKNNKRRFKTAYIEIARKNGKSTWLATEGLYQTGYDGEHSPQIFTAATKKDQARIIHRISTRMVKASPALRKSLGTFKDSIFCESMGGTFIPLGQDSKTEDGWNVQAALVDEYHAHPDSSLYDVLRSGMGSREQPLMMAITTAGFDKSSACYQEHEYLVSILEQTFQDESYFGVIYTVDDEEKWDNETEWLKANPNLTVSVSLDDMRDMCLKAQNSPSKQNEFKTKKLNIWTETLTRWITSEAWDACGTPVDVDGLAGRECVGAFDLSSVSDLTAWVLCFKPSIAGEPYRFIYRFFLPQYDLEKRFVSRDVLGQIQNWIRLGFITTTPGNSIDYDFVHEQIRADAERFDIKEIPFDPYNATQIVNDLMKDGFEMLPFRQGYLTMSPAAKSFEAAVLDGKIAHGNNPVMRWMVSCTDVQSDPAGNIKPVKPDRGKTSKRIDGVIASIMAFSRAVDQADHKSIYETRGILFV
jgi:phage terminase large subunit-like protein